MQLLVSGIHLANFS